MERPNDILIQRVLNEKATPDEAQWVAKWFATDEGCRWLSTHMDNFAEQILSGKIPVLADLPADELLQRINKEINRRRRRMIFLRVAAVLIPCAIIIAAWIDLSNRLGDQPFSTPVQQKEICVRGERRQIIFQDGTKIWLNAGTTLSYPSHFGLSERRVRLDGEAYFEVTPNARRQFVVDINDVEVRVLGTSFNVEAYDNKSTIDVVLIDGTVEFAAGTEKYIMGPSQKLVYDKTSKQTTLSHESNADVHALWHNNIIYFRDTPLGDVISTLEDWYDCHFFVADAAAYKRRFSLKTPELPLTELLNEMQQISDVVFTVKGKEVTVNIK